MNRNIFMNIYIPSAIRHQKRKKRKYSVNRKLIFPWEFCVYTIMNTKLPLRKLYNFCYEFSRTFETIFCNIIIFHNVLYFLLWKKYPTISFFTILLLWNYGSIRRRVCIRVDTLNSVMMITRSTQITRRERRKKQEFHFTEKKIKWCCYQSKNTEIGYVCKMW